MADVTTDTSERAEEVEALLDEAETEQMQEIEDLMEEMERMDELQRIQERSESMDCLHEQLEESRPSNHKDEPHMLACPCPKCTPRC